MLSVKFERFLFCFIIMLMVILLTGYVFFPLEYVKEINDVACEMLVDPTLIAAIIKLESDFKELALSNSGAFGLMQLMPETANWLSTEYLIRGSWRDPHNNIKLGSFYLKRLFSEFDNDINHTLNAYHMGPNRLKSLLAENENFRKTTYTKRINLYQSVYKILYHGFFVYPGE